MSAEVANETVFWRLEALLARCPSRHRLEIRFGGGEPYVRSHQVAPSTIYLRFQIGVMNRGDRALSDLRVDWDSTVFTSHLDEELQRSGLDAAPVIGPQQERFVFLFGLLEDRQSLQRDRVLGRSHRFTVTAQAGAGAKTSLAFVYDPASPRMLATG